MDNLEHELCWESPWIKVFKTKSGFIYSERKGRDSIAFMLISKKDGDEKPFGVISEFRQPLNKFLVSAYGGTIDKHHENLKLLVIEEAREEAGFKVEEKDVRYFGKIYASNMMNQFVYLFTVEVDKNEQGERTTTDKNELSARPVWIDAEELQKLQDWKSIVLYNRFIDSVPLEKIKNIPEE